MPDGGLTSGWGEIVAEALADVPPAPEDIQPFSEVVASGAPLPPSFVDAFDGYFDDTQDESGSATVGISREQWIILVLTHIPLIVLWSYALLGVFERASIAARWVSKMLGFAQPSEEAFEDDDDETRRLVAGAYQHPDHPHRRSVRPLPDELPYVCVQLPMYNEPAVARRVIDAACLLRWPRDLLEIQVLDDSDDDACVSIVDTTAAAWRERGLMCNVVRRSHRRGFKAGALEAGRKKTAADLIAVFDADCIPPADYLERVVPHFYGNDGAPVEDMAMVQARWGFLNYDDGILTMAQSMRLEAYRAAGGAVISRSAGCVLAAGAGATWSARAVTAVGGWDATAILESMDLALRAYCAGYQSKFLPHTVVMTELPSTFAAYKSQQERWVRGLAQIAKRRALGLLRVHSQPLWKRWYLFSAVMRPTAWPAALVWMLALPMLIRAGHGWWLGTGDVAPRMAALILYAAPLVLLAAADAVAAAALPPAPPLLMKHGQAAAMRISWLLPYVIVQTGMVVAHAAAFVAGAAAPRTEFLRTPKDGRGGFYRVEPERARATGSSEAGAGEASASGADGKPTVDVVSVGGSTSEPTTPTSRHPGESAVGHPFEVQNRVRGGGAMKSTRPASIPGTPQRPTSGATTGSSKTAGGDTYGDPDARRIAAAVAAAGGPERSTGSARRRWATFAAESTVAAAMLSLSFAVAAADGWRGPAFACGFIALCVLYVACHNWDDTWRRGLRRGLRARDSYPEALLGGVSSDTYGGLDERAAGASRGGVYDHVRRRGASGGPDAPSGSDAPGFEPPRDPQTRAAIRQYKRYRAKDFDLDTISVRSLDSDAYSAGANAFGGPGGRAGGMGSALGSEFGGNSEAGYSETVRSELSAAVFADAPPVLLTAAQLRTHHAAAPGSRGAPSCADPEAVPAGEDL